ncbi:hypothetical protein U14_03145 [Candidatus Moduliflexus flocculans]|uniref:Uncharacterized protein n=1 Tax=Candidatus Moduliflexus flocculans TaxID=1499966 RepID=A0A081BND3_9BACT|nr:hypothetical protein U14_03145 [Candidatus Moduliflexus flocculans]
MPQQSLSIHKNRLKHATLRVNRIHFVKTLHPPDPAPYMRVSILSNKKYLIEKMTANHARSHSSLINLSIVEPQNESHQ